MNQTGLKSLIFVAEFQFDPQYIRCSLNLVLVQNF